MTRRNLENNELGGVIREKINDNFIDLYNATGRGVSVLPTLATRFGVSNRIYNGAQFVDEAVTTTYSVTRGSVGTYTNAIGAIVEVGTNVPRYTFDRATGELLGLLIEEQRTRLNTISLLPTAPEAVTVTAAQHTISFYGTGSVVLSGVHSATLVGTGSGRVTLTFTPAAGVLTLTPSGSVNDLQLELGATASSVIRGEGSAQTRLADNVSRTLGAEFNKDQGSFYINLNVVSLPSSGYGRLLSITDGTTNNRLSFQWRLSPSNSTKVNVRAVVSKNGTTYVGADSTIDLGSFKVLLKWTTDTVTIHQGNQQVELTIPSSPSFPTLNTLIINSITDVNSNAQGLANFKDLRYYPRALSSAEAQSLTKI
jgi:hypothetical protein